MRFVNEAWEWAKLLLTGALLLVLGLFLLGVLMQFLTSIGNVPAW